MTRLVDWQIEKLNYDLATRPVITPFVPHQVSHDDQGAKVISYGLSAAGYDIRIADEYLIFAPVPGDAGTPVDPKKFDDRLLVPYRGPYCTVPPHSYVLAKSVETFDIPEDMVVTCLGKSTYARCGLHVNVTPLEPGWRGTLTIEISNAGPSPVKIYSNEGIAQLLFDLLKGPARVSYRKRNGKYQDQVGIVPPRMLEKT